MRGERVGEALRAAACHGPSDVDARSSSGRRRTLRWQGCCSDSIECAEQPASRARARSPSKRDRASPTAERRATGAKRAISEGMPRRPQRAEDLPHQVVGACGPADRTAAGRRPRPGPRPSAVSLHRALEQHRGAVVEGVRERRVGMDQLEPVLGERQAARKGEASARACTVEQVSCTKPGSVSSSERQPPPMVSAPSRTVTRRPARASTIAADEPVRARADYDRVGRAIRQPRGRA